MAVNCSHLYLPQTGIQSIMLTFFQENVEVSILKRIFDTN